MVDRRKRNTTSTPVSRLAEGNSASSVSRPMQESNARVTKNRRPQKSRKNLSTPAVAAAAAAAPQSDQDQAATAPSTGGRGNNNSANQRTSDPQPRTGAGGKIPLEEELVLTNGKKTTLKKQLDTSDRGGLIVFVYPNASSEAAIDYAQDFDYRIFNYERAEMTMIGLSPDSSSANAKFKTDTDLHFTLLSDPRKTVLNAVGLSTISKTDKKFKNVGVFVLDKSGTLLYVKSGKPEKVVDELDRKMHLEIMGLSSDEED